MTNPPARPKIYHIVHVDKLPSIIHDGCLWCDKVISQRPGSGTTIGMSSIKERRLALPVRCHPGDCVGDYVPFYFCFRSVMLYLIYRGNHPELAYSGGQGPIVHLEADLHEVVAWASNAGRRWAFTLSNAGAYYAPFRSSLDDLGEINWSAVAATDWRAPEIKDAKQAEFLVHRSFPWELVSRMGVRSMSIRSRVVDALQFTQHKPKVEIIQEWYY